MEATLAYGIGDKVVHPHYGASIVKRLVRRTISGATHRYYLIEPLALDETEIMVSVDGAKRVGLRDAVKRSVMARALRALAGLPRQLSSDYKKRQARIKEQLESKDLHELAEAARDLAAFRRERNGRLGVSDTKLLLRARDRLAGELALVEDISFEEAMSRIDDTLILSGEVLAPPI